MKEQIISKVFLEIEKAIKENVQIIEELLVIDKKYCKTTINTNMLIETIRELKKEKEDTKKGQYIKIVYNGNPCTTINMCLLAIITENTLTLDYEDNMKGINTFIIKIVNNILQKNKINKQIHSTNEKENIDKIICIDNINKYNNYLRQGITNAKFYSHNYIDFYSDCSEYEEIEELIYRYANENQIPIEVYSELDIINAIQMIQKGFGKSIVVLTNKEETKQIFEKQIKNKKIYVNKNPYKENIRIINKEIFNI